MKKIDKQIEFWAHMLDESFNKEQLNKDDEANAISQQIE